MKDALRGDAEPERHTLAECPLEGCKVCEPPAGLAAVCACGCGLPTSGRFSTTTGEPVRYRPGHYRGRHVPMSDRERRTILEEIAAGVGWTESYIGEVRPVSADTERVRAALGHTMKCFNASPTLRRVLARLAVEPHHPE